MWKHLLLVILLQISGVFSHPRIKRATKQNKGPIQLKLKGYDNFLTERKWNQDPEDLILELISKWDCNQSPGNLTLIGWQTILNDNGTVKEVRTIELGLPGNSVNTTDVTIDFSGLSGDELELMVNDVMHYANDFKTKTGLEVVRSSQYYSYDEYLQFGFCVDARDVYFPISEEVPELAYLVRNLTVTSLDDVKKFMEENQGSIPSSLLVYDDLETENINLSESVIIPQHKIALDSQDNANVSMVEDAAKYVTTTYLAAKENAGEYIVSNMTEDYPEYKWFVTEDLNAYYVTRDVLMSFSFSDGILATNDVAIQLFGQKR